jgi:hypothetical protein
MHQLLKKKKKKTLNIDNTLRILLNNQHDAALSSRIYSSLRGYSTCFGCFLHPSSGVHAETRRVISQ